MALSTIPATDPSATGFGIPQNPDASAWRRCPTPGTGKSQFPPLLAIRRQLVLPTGANYSGRIL